jgi:hypothetical protein
MPALRQRHERGQVLVVVALGITGLLAAAGVAVDVGRFYSEHRFLQNAADAAALAAANALIRGESDADAIITAQSSLTRNFAGDPNGVVAPLPPSTPVYENGHAGDPEFLVNGILVSGGEVRVAVQNALGYTFGRVVGLGNQPISARARVELVGDLLPIAARRYVNAPGPSGGASYPCSLTSGRFADYLSTADTACLGSQTDPSLRTTASDGMAFDPLVPNNDPAHHGPVVELLGLGASPANGADFRGFVALDVRNFENSTSRQYFNGVTAGTDVNTLQALEADWIRRGYPGPDLPISTWPTLSYGSQVATMSGNSSGISIDAFDDRYAPGDAVLLLVYSGSVSAVPDFTVNPPGSVAIGTTQSLPVAGTFTVSRNTEFSGTVDVSVLSDSGNPADPIATGAITSVPAIAFNPNPVTPSLGVGATVTMENLSTTGATAGIYTLWLRGHSAVPYLRTHFEPFTLNVGDTKRNFSITSNAQAQSAPNPGDPVSWTLNISTTAGGLSNFNGDVTLSLDGPLPAGMGAVSWSGSTTITLGSGPAASHSRTVTVNSGTMAPGDYPLILRATGTNSTGRQVTHLLRLELHNQVSPPSVGYVDVLGFAVFRVTSISSDSVSGYAITPLYQSPNDSGLRRGQVARLVPWN